MARFLGGFLAVLVLVCCIAAGAMGGCTVGMPLMMIQSGSSNIGGFLFAGVICVGLAVGLYFGIRAAKAVFRSVANLRPLSPPTPPPRGPHEEREEDAR